MDENINSEKDLKDKVIFYTKANKGKIIILFFFFFLSLLSYFFYKSYNEKKNNLVSEKYIQAGIYLSEEKKDLSKKILEEIVLSKNEFYSILALNTILDKNIVTDKKKILEYFNVVENLNISKDQKDLIFFKKALYLIDNSEIEKGKKILKKIIEKNSKYKVLASEVLDN